MQGLTTLLLSAIWLLIALVATVFILQGLALIKSNQVGLLTKKMFGKKMPQGQVIARKGEIGLQADTLMPGLYWRNPIIWKINKVPVPEIAATEVGTVESIDGEAIPKGKLLGDDVECNHFQDCQKFLDNHGKKGPQVAILRPGTYRINTMAFQITKRNVTRIKEEEIGVVIAKDGTPLPPGYVVAPKPAMEHKFFQDGQAFLSEGGYRGPQLDTLQAGNYYINPLLFDVQTYDIAEVPPGYVAVLRSNVGLELERASDLPALLPEKSDFQFPIHEEAENILTMDKNKRGIWREPVAPGKYNLNPLAFTAYLVPTSAVTIDWASSSELKAAERMIDARGKQVVTSEQQVMEMRNKKAQEVTVKSNYEVKEVPPPIVREKEVPASEKATEFFRFSQLRVTSKDGFQLDVDVRMVIRIKAENAAFVIARFGSVSNLIQQIVHPLIDSSFRNKAGEKKAIEFVLSRTQLQAEALTKAHEEFAQYHVEAQNLLIAYIDVDKTLLDTQTKKEIALQQQEQYKQEAAAQEQRIQVMEREATAEKQPDVVSSRLSIEIEKNRAEALIQQSEGVKKSVMLKAEGDAFAAREVGKGIADAYEAQTKVLGSEAISMIKIIDEVGLQKVKIVPDVQVTGGDGQAGGNLFNAWMATMMKKQQDETKKSDMA